VPFSLLLLGGGHRLFEVDFDCLFDVEFFALSGEEVADEASVLIGLIKVDDSGDVLFVVINEIAQSIQTAFVVLCALEVSFGALVLDSFSESLQHFYESCQFLEEVTTSVIR
jgi:hypothetical protein